MKIFTWMQNKFSGRHGIKKPSFTIDQMLEEPQKEELSDYHYGLLAIGTFGKHNLKDDQVRRNLEGNLSSSEDHLQDLTLEELGKLQKDLNLLLHEQVQSTCSKESEATNLQLLDRESSLEAGLKILRAMLHKKICPHSSSKALSMKKYLENRHMPKSAAEDELNDESNNGSKWLNTDSELLKMFFQLELMIKMCQCCLSDDFKNDPNDLKGLYLHVNAISHNGISC
ncbi:hypothetical protein SO802_030103 [Lithocarpus litseifolius]|uniref:Uncharacterized protein n=1 Tax=Lithocarpus litseifolius TaxID=425828 RepID=A0AAW2BYC8_9ROSI